MRDGGAGIEPIVVETATYRLRLTRNAPTAMLEDERGEPWAELRLLASIDTLDGRDETHAIDGPELERDGAELRLTWEVSSSRWARKRLLIACTEEAVTFSAQVEGRGRLSDVSLLGGRSALAGTASGWFSSGRWFRTLFSGAPSDPRRVVQSAGESADNSAAGGSEPGRGHWFFTPGPLCYAVNRARSDEPGRVPSGPWLGFGLAVPEGEATFLGFGYRAMDGGFHFALDYEGHTEVLGTWRTPAIVIAPASSPYEAIADHRRRTETRAGGAAVEAATGATPDWWREPIFCGWGAQATLARTGDLPLSAAPTFATEQNYDRFLAHLEARGVIPGTIAIDDKWARTYGACEPDPLKWPDLKGWIARRRSQDQRVVLWWKAWDPEGLPADWCVRTPAGHPVAIDPDHPDGERAIRGAIRRILAADALDADGLKIDFTARTPSGSSLLHHGDGWGIELLRRLLSIVRDEAKSLKPDSLLIGQTPEPSLAPLVDMIRLNDMLRLDDPEPRARIVPQMRYRAGLVAAACPDKLIDTDDWCAPDLANWREYVALKPSLGVPALYYATGLDLSGEEFTDEDYELIRRTWAAYRRKQGLPSRDRAGT